MSDTKAPKVSVIIPNYNNAPYLEQCLDSVINQTLKDIEIIVIDDGSTDNSREILDRLAKKDPRIKTIKQKNHGVSFSRNRGIKTASGEYIAFMDPDDYYPDSMVLKKLYVVANKENANVCGGSFSSLLPDGSINSDYSFSWELFGYTFSKSGWVNYSDYQFDYGFHRFLYKKSMIIDNKLFFPPFSRYQDPPWFIRVMFCAKKFYALNYIVYTYREGDLNSNYKKWTIKKVDDFSKAISSEIKFAKKNNLRILYNLSVIHLLSHVSNILAPSLCEVDKDKYNFVIEVLRQIDVNMLSGESAIQFNMYFSIIQQLRSLAEKNNNNKS